MDEQRTIRSDTPPVQPTVSQSLYDECKEDLQTLRDLINGEWVDCDKVCRAMNIDFKEGIRLFDFGRQAFWNPAPLNGQRVITKFRIAEKTVQPAKPFIDEEEQLYLSSKGCW